MTVPISYKVVLSKRATVNLDAIFEVVSKDSLQNASALIARLKEAIARLEIFPKRTLVQDPAEHRHPVRSLPVESYIVFFRVIDEHRIVRILEVRHGARQRPSRFQ